MYDLTEAPHPNSASGWIVQLLTMHMTTLHAPASFACGCASLYCFVYALTVQNDDAYYPSINIVRNVSSSFKEHMQKIHIPL